MKDLGECRDILGIQIEWNCKRRSLKISQNRYAEKIIERFEISEAKGQSNPMDCNMYFRVTDE